MPMLGVLEAAGQQMPIPPEFTPDRLASERVRSRPRTLTAMAARWTVGRLDAAERLRLLRSSRKSRAGRSRPDNPETRDACGQVSAVAEEHRVDRLEIAGIEVFQHRDQTSRLDVRIDMKARQSRKTGTGRRQLLHRFAIGDE
jgi:hypothetical protein